MVKLLPLYFLAAFVLGIWGCTAIGDSEKVPLAKVGEKVLFLSDLREILPRDISPADSSMLADDYINKWVRTELLIKKAEENLKTSPKEMEKELEEYRNSLVIYRYTRDLMLQRMDTSLSNNELTEYYEVNKENFKLNKNIVKAIFIKIPKEVSHPERAKVFCEQISGNQLNELREFCLKYASSFDLFVDNWVDFALILQNLPTQIDDPEKFLRQNSPFETHDSQFYYLVCVLSYKLVNEVSPMDYVKSDIKNLILNKRKIDFLKKVEDDVYAEGIRNSKFTIYNVENK